MANFKIGNTTPLVGNIKAGSTNVIRIMNGAIQVWPPLATLINLCFGTSDFDVCCECDVAPTTANIQISNNSNNNSTTIDSVTINGTAIIVNSGAFPITNTTPVLGIYSVPSSAPYEITVYSSNSTNAPVTITSSGDPLNPFCLNTTGQLTCNTFDLSQGPSIVIDLGSDGEACQ
jgi:hypothetical protein